MTLTRADIEKLKALAEAATNAPWIVQTGVYTGDNWLIAMCGLDTPTNEEVYVTTDLVRSSELNDGTAKDCGLFIAASREAIPALIKHIEDLETIIARLSNIPK